MQTVIIWLQAYLSLLATFTKYQWPWRSATGMIYLPRGPRVRSYATAADRKSQSPINVFVFIDKYGLCFVSGCRLAVCGRPIAQQVTDEYPWNLWKWSAAWNEKQSLILWVSSGYKYWIIYFTLILCEPAMHLLVAGYWLSRVLDNAFDC